MLYKSQRETAIRQLGSSLEMSREAFLQLPRRQVQAGVHFGLNGMIEAGFQWEGEILDDATEPDWKRQFILAGATIPSLGTKNVKDDIQFLFPSMEFVSTENLHRVSSALNYDWIQVSEEERMEVLLKVIQRDPVCLNRSGKALVFVCNANTADQVIDFLRQNDVVCVPYHKNLGSMLRRSNLERFRDETGIVMVCTDGMSRGMDVPDVNHVIQSDFAPSAMAFVHRVGRTGRAGKGGNVTSLFSESDVILVDAIRNAIEDGIPIEGAFSRNRSFRKKVKRYGSYVPRGDVPNKTEECMEEECPL